MKKTILLFAIIFSLFSCSKDDEPTPIIQKTKTDLLIEKNWKLDKYETKAGSNVFSDQTSTVLCKLDDTYTFNFNNNYEINSGTVKCGSESLITSYLWYLSNDGTKL